MTVFILQGNAGIGLSLLIIVLTLLVALAPALSAIGICERTHVESGGVYFLLAHVLGQRSGGTIGILYSFGMVRKIVSPDCFLSEHLVPGGGGSGERW